MPNNLTKRFIKMSNKSDLVIFGGMGDLSIRKLIPALYRANAANQLSQGSKIFLIARDERSNDENLKIVDHALKEHLDSGEYEPAL